MEYLRSCWEALVPPRELRAHAYPYLESYGGGAQSIVVVTDAADERVQVRPLLRATDVYEVSRV